MKQLSQQRGAPPPPLLLLLGLLALALLGPDVTRGSSAPCNIQDIVLNQTLTIGQVGGTAACYCSQGLGAHPVGNKGWSQVESGDCAGNKHLQIHHAPVRWHLQATCPTPHTHTPLPTISKQQETDNRTEMLTAQLRQLCAPRMDVVDAGTVCNATSLCQLTEELLVPILVCLNGRWTWTTRLPTPFCPQWAHCSWHNFTQLRCDGRSRPENQSSQSVIPANLDPATTHIEIVYDGIEIVNTDVTQYLTNLQLLNISHNVLTAVGPFTLTKIPSLNVIDASYNLIGELDPYYLPIDGSVRWLDLRHNELSRIKDIAANTLSAAVTYCAALNEPVPNTTLLFDNFAFSTEVVMGLTNTPCVRVTNTSVLSPVNLPCSANSSVTIPEQFVCDGIGDCPDLSDESRCQYTGSMMPSVYTSQPSTLCYALTLCASPNISVQGRTGLIILQQNETDDCPLQSYVSLLTTMLETEAPNSYRAGINSWEVVGEVRWIVSGNVGTFQIAGRFLAFSDNSDFNCSLYFALDFAEDDGPATTPPSTTIGTASSAATSNNTVVGLSVGLSVTGALIAILLFAGLARRWRRLGKVLQAENPAMALLHHCRAVANDKLTLQYRSMWNKEAVGEYNRLCLRQSEIAVGDEVLGMGQFGVVSTGMLLADRRVVAVKTLKGMDEQLLSQFLLEMRLLSTMRHPNVVRLLGVQEATFPILLLMEYCEQGDLRGFLKCGKAARLHGGLGNAHWDMARQVARAVAYLHSKLCVHRDLAARNVLVTENVEKNDGPGISRCGVVMKLADLGLSRTLKSEDEYYRMPVAAAVPVRWMCPLALRSKTFTTKSDVYSFGVVVYEIFSDGGTPFADLQVTEVVKFVSSGQRLPRPNLETPESIVKLIWDCTQMTVSRRPAMATVAALLEDPTAGGVREGPEGEERRRGGAGAVVGAGAGAGAAGVGAGVTVGAFGEDEAVENEESEL